MCSSDLLSPNTYTGSVTVVTNAANSPTVIPVTFQVLATAAPTIFYQGVVDDAVFGQDGLTVTPGDVIALFGQQLDANLRRRMLKMTLYTNN